MQSWLVKLKSTYFPSIEADFIQGILNKHEQKLGRSFNFTFCYIGDVLSLYTFSEFVDHIYPIELQIKDTQLGTLLVPIGMMTLCWKIYPPKITNSCVEGREVKCFNVIAWGEGHGLCVLRHIFNLFLSFLLLHIRHPSCNTKNTRTQASPRTPLYCRVCHIIDIYSISS
jgi:hypothetical protein